MVGSYSFNSSKELRERVLYVPNTRKLYTFEVVDYADLIVTLARGQPARHTGRWTELGLPLRSDQRHQQSPGIPWKQQVIWNFPWYTGWSLSRRNGPRGLESLGCTC